MSSVVHTATPSATPPSLRATAALAVVAASVVLVSGCGSTGASDTTKDVNIANVEHAIERSIAKQRHLESKVVCPATVAQKPGKFACIATTFSAKQPSKEIKTPFLVTVHNSKGYITYVGK